MIRYRLNHLRFLEEQLEELDRDVVAKIRQAGLEPQWKFVQSVPGVAEGSAATILAETGTDLQQVPSEGDFSSWAGVWPGNNRSADKNKSSHTTGGNPWLCSIMTQCAWAAAQPRKTAI
jgi:transposase